MSSSSDSSDDDTGMSKPGHRKGLNAANFAQTEAVDEDDTSNSSESMDDSSVEEDQNDIKFIASDDEDEDNNTVASHLSHEFRRSRSEKKQVQDYIQRFEGSGYHENEVYEVVDDDQSFSTSLLRWRASLIPTANTKKVFLVEVKPSKELAVVYFLMRRYFHDSEPKYPTVYSAFYTSKGSGQIYVEAITRREVLAIRLNAPNVPNKEIKLVPPEQMSGALSPPRNRDRLRPGQFIRVRRDLKLYESYTNDLAQVINVDKNNNHVLVKLVPRIDYSGLEKNKRELSGNHDDDDDTTNNEIWQTTLTKLKIDRTKRSDQANYRPQQDDFDYQKLSHITTVHDVSVKKSFFKHIPEGAREEINGKIYDWDSTNFYSTFAYKVYPIDRVKTIDKLTNDNETKRFVDGLEQTQFEKKIPHFYDNMLDSLGMTTNVAFGVGDIAVIADGENEGLVVRIDSINNDLATVKAVDESIYDDFLQISVNDLRKHFDSGDHVKIQGGGQYHGLTGEVQVIEGNMANILLDNNNEVVDVPVNQLSMTHEINQGQQSIGEYQLFDYVRLTDKSSRGVIWRIENDTIYLLLTSGESKTTTLDGISIKEKDYPARDAHNQPIIIGQTVIVDNHDFRQVRAQVKHIGHECIFLYNNSSQFKYNGLFVAEPRNCQASTHQSQSNTNYNARNVQSGRQQIDRHLIGKTIQITSGKYKSQLADIQSANQSTITVIMHNTSRPLTLSRQAEASEHNSYMHGNHSNSAHWKLISPKSTASSDPFSRAFSSHKRKSEERDDRDDEAEYGQSQSRIPPPTYGSTIPPAPSYGAASPYPQDYRSPQYTPSYISPYPAQSPPSYPYANQGYNQYSNRHY